MLRSYLLCSFILFTGCSTYQQSPDPSVNHLYDYQPLHSGKPVSLNQVSHSLSEADVILLGEFHSHAGIHRFQTELLEELHRSGIKVALAMEQFSRDKQSILDKYILDEIGEERFIKESDAWANYRSDYRPLVEFSKANNIAVIAANAPDRLVKCVNRQGVEFLDKLDGEQRSYVAADIDTSDSAYKQQFKTAMHHGNDEQLEKLYAAQVTRDETMAESIVLSIENNQNQKIVLTAGTFHTQGGLGVASAIERRAPSLKIAIISPVFEPSKGDIEAFQLLVQRLPKAYLKDEVTRFHFNGSKTDSGECSI